MPHPPAEPAPAPLPEAVGLTSPSTATAPDPLELLARDDKWQLGGGDGVLFAPLFPLWLDRPGFWDPATIHHWTLEPLFTIAVLDEQGREVALQATARRWTPAELIVEYRLANGMHATEVRTVHPGGIFVSEWRLRAFKRARLNMIMWTRQPAAAMDVRSVAFAGALAFVRRLRDDSGATLELQTELGCSGGVASWMAVGGDETGPHPDWRLTPFVERWRADGLPRTAQGIEGKPLCFAAVHRIVTLDGESGAAVFAMRVSARDPAYRGAEPPAFAHHAFTLGGVSRRRWRGRFESVPQFRCSDPYFETAYWYRWYALFLNHVATPAGHLEAPCITEGLAHRHLVTARATTGAVRDLRWLPDPGPARNALRAMLGRRSADGRIPAVLRASGSTDDWAPEAGWGDAVLALHDAWPDRAFLQECYAALDSYARWLVTTRDPSATGVIGVDAGPLTAPESPSAVSATIAAYQLFRLLERAAIELGRDTDVPRWTALAGRSAAALRSRLWDDADSVFRDPAMVAPVRRASDYAPFATDVADERHGAALDRYLLDPEMFWTPFPAPSYVAAMAGAGTSVHGRVDPATDAMLVDALATTARHAPRLLESAAHLLRRFIHMTFHDGDLREPNAFDDYDPLTGHASVHRGLDDGTRGWLADLIIRHAAGVRPDRRGIVIDPLPSGLDFVEFGPAAVRGRQVHVRIDGSRVQAFVDGARHEQEIGGRIVIPD